MSDNPLVIWFQARLNVQSETGAAAVEYALLAALIALAIIASVGLLGVKLNTVFQNIRTALP
jgi:pilus assembly protein Flp/PilA